jgi:hypothetical protein
VGERLKAENKKLGQTYGGQFRRPGVSDKGGVDDGRAPGQYIGGDDRQSEFKYIFVGRISHAILTCFPNLMINARTSIFFWLAFARDGGSQHQKQLDFEWGISLIAFS